MSVAGNWHLVLDSPMGEQKAAVELEEEDGELTGVLTNLGNNISSEIFDGEVDGNDLTWKIKLKQLRLTLAFTLTRADDRVQGKVKAGLFGSFDVSGQRQ
jgi:hypothetical protein